MADTKVEDETAATTPLTGTEVFYCVQAGSPRKALTSDIKNYSQSANTPIVILTSGQSNFVLTPVLNWTPADNAHLWNWDGTIGHVGTAFTAIPTATTQATWKFASEIAKAYPGRSIYLVNVSLSATAISHWIAGTPAPDVYASVKANIEAALTVLGLTKIDIMAWWQGESDIAAPTTWLTSFGTMMAQFKAETWFPQTTPVMLCGVALGSLGAGPTQDRINNYIQAAANLAPDTRRFVPSGAIVGASFWLDTIHMTGLGYDAFGTLLANEFLDGSFRGKAAFITDDVGGAVGLGIIPLASTGTPARLSLSNNALNKVFNPPPAGSVLHLVGGDGAAVHLTMDSFGNPFNAFYWARAARGTIDVPTAIQSGDPLGTYAWAGYGATAWPIVGANISAFATQNFTDTHLGSKIVAQVVANNAAAPQTALTLDQDKTAIFGGTLDLTAAASGQISFPATQNPSAGANVLDDYEEGTWTPGFTFGGGTTGLTYGYQVGRYTKVGRDCDCQFSVALFAKGSSAGSAVMTGLPFTTTVVANAYSAFVPVVTAMTTPIGGTLISPSGTTVNLYQANSLTAITDAGFQNSTIVSGNFSFEVS